MKLPSMWRIIVCCTLFLFNGSLPHAQVGKLEDVILAAKSDVEPPYIGELLTVLQQKLLGFVKQQPSWSETDEFALFLTMWGILREAAEATLEAAKAASWDAVFKSARVHNRIYSLTSDAWAAAIRASGKAGLECVRTSIRKAVWAVHLEAGRTAVVAAEQQNKCRNTAKDAAESAALAELNLGVNREVVANIAYRVSEWIVLNKFVEDCETILPAVYEKTWGTLSCEFEPNPFGNEEKAIAFYNKHFRSINPSVQIFVLPWFFQIRATRNFWGWQNFFTFASGFAAKSGVLVTSVHLPSELVRFILTLFVQMHFLNINEK